MPTIAPPSRVTPLASALRPKTLDDVIGQEHLLGVGKPVRMMAIKRRAQSTILWGPPGTGKTTLIRALASDTDSTFIPINATNATVKDLRSVIKAAHDRQPQSTFVFVDEVHRFSKSQQDVLLPVVEDGTIILFGATTEKPKFAVNATILSRCIVLETKPLDAQSSITLFKRVKAHYKNLGRAIKIDQEAAKRLIMRASGDARKMITVLETAIEILSSDDHVTVEHINTAMPDKHIVFDASGNEHFDHAHAMQEAVQHSDADAAVYWLAKWVASGEDPAYIARRIIVTAFEDAGDNHMAITSAMAAHYAVERVGLPECLIPMSHAIIAAAQSGRDKTAYKAIKEAIEDVENGVTIHIPPELRAGTVGYVSPIKKKYVSRMLVEQAQDKPQKLPESAGSWHGRKGVLYATEKIGGGWIAGPEPEVDSLIAYAGCVGDRIVKLNSDDNEEVIVFKWDDTAAVWVSCYEVKDNG